jgi:hypothetical protein
MTLDGTRLRATAMAALMTLLLAACSADGGGASPVPTPSPASTAAADAAGSAASETVSAAPAFPWERVAAGEDVPGAETLEEIRSGGPPPDGIPPIDDPEFEAVEAAGEWLTDRDPVLVVEVDGAVKAYPLAIMTWHEIVNDTIAGEPVVVTYCPLCNSALVFSRVVGGEVLDFGTSGRLLNSNLVMYDRQGRNLWSQYTGEVLVGNRLGDELRRIPAQIVSWSDVAANLPDARVLSRDTGVERPYGTNPYQGYDEGDSPFLFDGETSDALPQMARVVALRGEPPVALPLRRLREERVVEVDVDGEPVVVLWTPGTASALGDADIDQAADVGATGAFAALYQGEPLDLRPADGMFVDASRDLTVDVLGNVEGGGSLTRLPHDDTFWFVQFAFRPDTRVAAG